MTEVKIVVAGVEMTTTRHVGWKEIMEYVEIGRRAIRRLEEEEDFPIPHTTRQRQSLCLCRRSGKMDAKNGEAKKRDAKTRIRPLIADKAHTTIKPQSAMLHPNFFRGEAWRIWRTSQTS